MPTEAELKKRIREAYEADKTGKRPATLKYVALFVVIILVAVLFVMTTSVGQNLVWSKTVSVNSQQEAQRVANDLGQGLGDIANTLNDIGNSLGG